MNTSPGIFDFLFQTLRLFQADHPDLPVPLICGLFFLAMFAYLGIGYAVIERLRSIRWAPRAMTAKLHRTDRRILELRAAIAAIGAYHGDASAQPHLTQVDFYARYLADLKLRVASWDLLAYGDARNRLLDPLELEVRRFATAIERKLERLKSTPLDLPTIDPTERTRLVKWIINDGFERGEREFAFITHPGRGYYD